MDALLKLNAVADINDLHGIRGLYDKIKTHVRSLENLGTSSESNGSLLIPVIVNKLPEELQLVISQKLDKGKWDIEQFIKDFKTELEARERCCMINNSHSTVKKDGASRNKGRLPYYTSSTLFAGKDRPYIPTCVYCNQQLQPLNAMLSPNPI